MDMLLVRISRPEVESVGPSMARDCTVLYAIPDLGQHRGFTVVNLCSNRKKFVCGKVQSYMAIEVQSYMAARAESYGTARN